MDPGAGGGVPYWVWPCELVALVLTAVVAAVPMRKGIRILEAWEF